MLDPVTPTQDGRVRLHSSMIEGLIRGRRMETWKRVRKEEGVHTFLPTAQLLDTLLIVMFAVETDTDANTGVVLYSFASTPFLGSSCRRSVVIVGIFIFRSSP